MTQPIKRVVTTAMLIAVGLMLPTLFHLIPGGGSTLLPLHLPVLICGLVCGAPYGALCGLLLPLLSSLLTSMPPIFPTAVAMAFELCTYGAVTGLLYRWAKRPLYLSLVAGMVAGRAVLGLANLILMGVTGTPYGLSLFLSSAFVTGLPGICIQLVLVPLVVTALIRAGFVKKPQV